jgi:hypothetical protein
MKSTSTASKSNGLVGIWFSQGNYTGTVMKGLESNKADDWRDSMISVGFGLDGVLPPNFSGVGVVLSYSAGTITLITSDGSAGSPNYRLDTSKNTISNFDFRRPGVKITLSINRKRNGFHVYVFDSEKNRANLELDGIHTIPTSGFFGFAGYTGTSDTTYRVLIRQIKSVNLDLASGSGEAGPTEVGEKHKINLDELVHDDDDMLEDPLQQIKDLQKATSILSEYLADSRYRDSAMVRNLGDIQARAHSLQDAIDDLRAELRISFKAGAGSGKDLLGEVMSLKELVKIHSEENSSLEGFREDLKKLHEETTDETDSNVVQNIASANRELADEVSRANFTANLVIGIFGITVMGLGLVLFFKMRQYEKKHFL